ncbi:unnamed protein product [Leptidea sinapis]|uniref:Uncharacterized protein n=1 Tax=Leptidea sinapis TaxID=189913 RepID=A0A5E4R1C7_9NEOP|nr:unnamed protein product [Leptidea sinapis]
MVMRDIILTIWMCELSFHVLQSCGMSFLVRCFRDDTTWVPSKKARTSSLKAGNAPIVGGGDHLTPGDPYARFEALCGCVSHVDAVDYGGMTPLLASIGENVGGGDHLTPGHPYARLAWFDKTRTPFLKAGKSPVIPLVLQENVGGGDHLTPGDPYARFVRCVVASERRAARIIDHQVISDRLDSLALRRDVGYFCIFYCIYHGESSEELFGLIPAAKLHHRTSLPLGI